MKSCPFCDSKKHYISNCGLYDGFTRKLQQTEYKLMLSSKPNFEIYPTNELKMIAHIFRFEKCINFVIGETDKCPNYKQKYDFVPIPLTLSRKRLIYALNTRWFKLTNTRKSKIVDQPSEECPICYEEFPTQFYHEYSYWVTHCVKLHCNHKICKSCVQRLFDNHTSPKCPMCRKNFQQIDIFKYMYEDEVIIHK